MSIRKDAALACARKILPEATDEHVALAASIIQLDVKHDEQQQEIEQLTKAPVTPIRREG